MSGLRELYQRGKKAILMKEMNKDIRRKEKEERRERRERRERDQKREEEKEEREWHAVFCFFSF